MKDLNEKFDLSKKLSDKRLRQFATILLGIQEKLDFKVSSRGWAYQLEQLRWINKDQFDKVEEAINTARKRGYLPVDFVAEEAARQFSGVEIPSTGEPRDIVPRFLHGIIDGWRYFTPEWWEGEEYYIQVVVEKIDLKTLFEPVCHSFHIPIANSKGWSSVLQRAEYARRFKQAEDMGLKCVLLYCGDHDPDGLRISDTLRKNLSDLSDIVWGDGTLGYNPENLIVDRFGLNLDFINENKLTWIDNLITGSGKDLNDPKHPNYDLAYLKEYKKAIGIRKCEANAIVVIPEAAREMMRQVILSYLGDDAPDRFRAKVLEVRTAYDKFIEESGLGNSVRAALKLFDSKNIAEDDSNDDSTLPSE